VTGSCAAISTTVGTPLLLVLLCVGSCAGPGPSTEPPSAADAEAILAKITTSKGIHYAEASAITQVYFATFLSGCGFAEGPTLRQGVWRSRARVGYAGELLSGAIEVNPTTGGIGYTGCPVFQTLEEFRDGVERVRRGARQGGDRSGPLELPCWIRNRTAG
jgi:hypothetical protein